MTLGWGPPSNSTLPMPLLCLRTLLRQPGTLSRVTIKTELFLRGDASRKSVLGQAPLGKGGPDGQTALQLNRGIMQQPKLFYPQHETYTPRPLERPDGQSNRPFPAFVLPENLASVGTPSLYHPPSQEKELFATPPAGFHMAPCGCFFDPRIYRIEWATANFVQPSVYKLPGAPAPQNTYLLDSQKYLKSPVQPVPYPPYQPVASNPPFVLPFFKPEGPSTNLADHIGFVGSPAHGSPFAEAVSLHGEGPGQSKERKLLSALPPGLNPSERPALVASYEPLKDCQDLAFQAFKDFQADEADDIRNPDFAEDPPAPLNASPEEHQAILGVPSVDIMAEAESCVDLESIIADGNALIEEEVSFNLPEKVLLEDAMKLFDCSPVNSDTEASLDGLGNGRHSRHWGDSLRDSCFSGEDSTSDIRSLNLPDELLSFDYSVPEILSAVTSLDYLYDVNAFGEELQWEARPPSQPPLQHESHVGLEEKAKSGVAKKNKPAAGQSKAASVQGGDGEPQGQDSTPLGI
ncbi:proline-rich protein 22 [Zootoca vivipara]|uniref:proline-rich protein 22 n=1 Tax=Zootoca vivipara TaxID=8524 RepID=UPI00293B8E69|nr:proline-rich protein 22 [Zootoca vivipara]